MEEARRPVRQGRPPPIGSGKGPKIDRIHIDRSLDFIGEINQWIKQSEPAIRAMTEISAHGDAIEDEPGFGEFFTQLIDGDRRQIAFRAPKKLAAYAGLVPPRLFERRQYLPQQDHQTRQQWLRWAFVGTVTPAVQFVRICLDLAKYVCEVHGVDSHGKVAVRKTVRRDAAAHVFANLPRFLVGMEASNGAHVGQWCFQIWTQGCLNSPQFVAPLRQVDQERPMRNPVRGDRPAIYALCAAEVDRSAGNPGLSSHSSRLVAHRSDSSIDS